MVSISSLSWLLGPRDLSLHHEWGCMAGAQPCAGTSRCSVKAEGEGGVWTYSRTDTGTLEALCFSTDAGSTGRWVSAAAQRPSSGEGRLLLSQSLLPGTLWEVHSRLFQGILSAADPFQDIIGCLAPSRPHLAFMGALGPHLQTQTSPTPLRGALSGELGLTSVSYGSGSHFLSWFPELDFLLSLCSHPHIVSPFHEWCPPCPASLGSSVSAVFLQTSGSLPLNPSPGRVCFLTVPP